MRFAIDCAPMMIHRVAFKLKNSSPFQWAPKGVALQLKRLLPLPRPRAMRKRFKSSVQLEQAELMSNEAVKVA